MSDLTTNVAALLAPGVKLTNLWLDIPGWATATSLDIITQQGTEGGDCRVFLAVAETHSGVRLRAIVLLTVDVTTGGMAVGVVQR